MMKTLFLALIALSFGACAATNATHSKAASASAFTATDPFTSTGAEFVGRSITPADANNHIGKRMTICGVVVSANYDARSSMRPTFLNLDEPYPRQIFTALIWGEDREKFGTPEVSLKEKRICVSGLIEEYRGAPQIILRKASQLVEEVD
jgi:hypothetical protein